MAKRSEPKAVREVHEIRERLYEQQKSWTPAERRAYDRIAKEAARDLNVRFIPHKPRNNARKHA